MGEPVGYRLMPAENAVPFAQDDAAVLRRAGFLRRHMWVTPYETNEKYAAGDYPNQRDEGDGLPSGRRRTARSPTPTWWSGTPSAIRISLGPRTGL